MCVSTTEQVPERAPLTQNQQRVLNSLAAFWQERQIPPTVRDLTTRLGFESTNAVRGHLEALRRKGYVTWEPKVQRSIRILSEAA